MRHESGDDRNHIDTHDNYYVFISIMMMMMMMMVCILTMIVII